MTASSHSNHTFLSENIPLISQQTEFFSRIEPEALNGKTDTMTLPESHTVIDFEASMALPVAGLSLVGILAFGALCLHHLHRQKRQTRDLLRPVPARSSQFLWFGDRSLAKIPKTARILHDRALASTSNLARRALFLDSDRFRESEFIGFAHLKYNILYSLDEHKELSRSIQRLEYALKARQHYKMIEQIEAEYQGPIQQQFYRFVTYLLAECPDRDSFLFLLQEKLEESCSLIVSATGREKLLEYFQAIETMIEEDCGLTLLCLFKYHQSHHASVLTMVTDLIESLERREDISEKAIAQVVRENSETMAQLQSILGLPESALYPESLAQILLYILFDRRYHLAFYKFEESIALLREWYLSYQVVIGIRQEHPATEYRQPKNFSASIPGLELYQKYELSLTQPSMVSTIDKE
jgi:hypothetical protein